MRLLPLLFVLILPACTTTETFSSDGKRTSRTSGPTPETWTTISNAVAVFGAQAVTSWTKQISNEQNWETGNK